MYVIEILGPVTDPVAIQIGPINIHWYAQGTLGQKGTLLSLRP